MKTPYYSGTFTAAQHTDTEDDYQLRERMLEHRLANRDDVREIHIVTALPFSERLRSNAAGTDLVKKVSKTSKTDLSWAMHWFVIPPPIIPLVKPVGSPETLFRDSRAPLETRMLT